MYTSFYTAARGAMEEQKKLETYREMMAKVQERLKGLYEKNPDKETQHKGSIDKA